MKPAQVDIVLLLHRLHVYHGNDVVAEAVLCHPQHAVVADIKEPAVTGQDGFVREWPDLNQTELPVVFRIEADSPRDLLDDCEVRPVGRPRTGYEQKENRKAHAV